MDKAEKLGMGHITQGFISHVKDFVFILCAKGIHQSFGARR